MDTPGARQSEERASDEAQHAGRWTWLLAGWLCGATLVAWSPPLQRPPRIERCALPGTQDRPRWVGSPGPRELRGLVGIGLRRGLDLARELWLDPSLAQTPERLPGIGPVTAAPLVEHLARRPER